jgi:sarcosine oxidase
LRLDFKESSVAQVYDYIVLGLGGFGSAALYHLAARGLRVLGLEQFEAGHDRGSSHGQTRIIRQAYFEHPDYVPLLKRAYEQWTALESVSQTSLANWCGLLLCGPERGETIAGARLASATHDLQIDDLSATDCREEFRGFQIPAGFSTLFEPQAGFLRVETCVTTYIDQARRLGVVIHARHGVTNWTSTQHAVRVCVEDEEYEAAGLVLTPGAWASTLAHCDLPLTVLRKPLFWFPLDHTEFSPTSHGPAFYFEMPTGAFYGFPSTDGETMKLAEHTGGLIVDDPLQVERNVIPDDLERLVPFIEQVIPGLPTQPQSHSVCMYTVTPDRHFIVDRHPEWSPVVLGAGFSGHGYKFAPVIGEALADLVTEHATELPIEFLSASRFR